MKKLSSAIGAFVLLGCALSASAQYIDYDLTIQNTMETMDLSNRLFQMRSAVETGPSSSGVSRAPRTPRGTASSGATPRQSTRSTASGTTSFSPVSRSIVPQQLAAKVSKTPQQRQAYEQTFTKLLEVYKDVARQNGAPLNDVARVTSYFINNNYMIYRGGQGLNDNQFSAMRKAVNEALMSDAKFQTMTNREKQEMYETTAIMGAYVIVGYAAAEQKGNESVKREVQQLAKRNLEKLLGPIDKVSFTNNGIEFK